jgi:hypothetical protein
MTFWAAEPNMIGAEILQISRYVMLSLMVWLWLGMDYFRRLSMVSNEKEQFGNAVLFCGQD